MIGPVLVASEDHGKRLEFSAMLRSIGYRVIEAENSLRTIDLLHRRKNIVLALLDVVMSDLGVGDVITMARNAGIFSPIIVIAQQDNQELLQKALKAGAIDYWIYPVTPLRLQVTLSNLLLISALEREVCYIQKKNKNQLRFSDLHMKSSAMQKILEQLRNSVSSVQNFLIEGEVGTDRETLAHIIHNESIFSEGSFVRFQCLSIVDPEEEKRAWFENFLPLISSLKKGTLCLCDVDKLGLMQQKRLMHYFKEKAESVKNENSQFRIISTSTSHLADLVNEDSFLRSLFEFLSPLHVNAPALRELRGDLLEISQRLIDRIIVETGRSHIHGLTGSALALLMQYDWPGNHSELENLLFRAVLLSEGPLLTVRDFPQLVGNPLFNSSNNMKGDIREYYGEKFIDFLNVDGHVRPFADMERDIIQKAVKHYKRRMSEVSRRLCIGRSTLYRKMEEYESNK
ncbi:sigma-54-dependent transcriptional regulator [Bartonella ancashensis]|uniref:DNA-binding transcriptional regulator NtrC n=1 Tax=Bartonella ancashensis TaxID=1318743 RepID=A0A0M4L951_9HYPH|nr:sigma 54-interacting transcriptional regulator [Bartonella ancashensis]ALE04126.1 Sigma 54 activator-like [Bartonella ancashensis]